MHGYSSEIIYKYYTYKLSQKITAKAYDNKNIADLLTKGITSNNINQWLASKCESCSSNYATFGVRIIYDGDVNNAGIFCSYNKNLTGNMRVRPIIILNSDVQL